MNIKNKKRLLTAAVAAGTLFSVAPFSAVSAAKNDLGYDWSSFQGPTGITNGIGGSFSFSKIGGDGYTYVNPYYGTQVAAGIARGLRMHSYIWQQDVTSTYQSDVLMDRYLPMVQTPKGSIVAIDVESGATSNEAIIHSMQRIKDAGYTPMFYSYKPYIQANGVDIDRIGQLFGQYSVWIAGYGYDVVGQTWSSELFPSMPNVGIHQYSSKGLPQGLDINIDLSGDKNWSITENGYKNGNPSKPKTDTPATDAGKTADNTPKHDMKVGDTVKVNFSANNWASGEQIPSWVKGKSYTVSEVSGNKVLLSGIMSWINKSDAEILLTQDVPAPQQTGQTGSYTVQSGDTLSAIASAHGITTANLQAINGISNPNLIYVGQVLKLAGSSNSSVAATSYTISYGDTLGGIASKFGTSVASLQAINGISNPNFVYAGQTINISGSQGYSNSRTYVVKSGDNLSTIAYKLGTSVYTLQAKNSIGNPSLIFPGQVLAY